MISALYIFQTQYLLNLGRQDSRSQATVKIFVYYTPQYRSKVSDPKGSIRNLIDVTNSAFANTQIPLRLSEFCIEELNTGESSNTEQRLQDTIRAKGSLRNLLKGADIAILMTSSGASRQIICLYQYALKSYSHCFLQSSNAGGAAYIGPSSQTRAPPVGWVKLGDALIFAHEVGHLFGCRHNREVMGGGSNNAYNYGYLMKGSKMRTIMAYPATGFSRWISAFSSKELKYKGVPLGNSKNDNR